MRAIKKTLAISLLVHEKVEVLLDQLNNINYYLKDVYVCIHVSKSFNLSKEDREKINKFNNVIINPNSFITKWGHIIHAHLSNFNYLYNNYDFDYISFHSSNDLFFQEGVETYLKKNDAGYNKQSVRKWKFFTDLKEDDSLKRMLSNLNSDKIIRSQIEGSFYNKELFKKVFDIIKENYDKEKIKNIYPREEIYLSTIAENLNEIESLGKPYIFSEIYFNKELINNFGFLRKLKITIKKIIKKIKSYLGIHFDFDLMTPNIINLLTERNFEKFNLDKINNLYIKDEIYGFKRAIRKKNTKLREYIRSKYKI